MIRSSISHHLAGHVIQCRWEELVSSLGTRTLGIKMCQSVNVLFVSLCLSSSSFSKWQGKIRRSLPKKGRAASSDPLPALTSRHLLLAPLRTPHHGRGTPLLRHAGQLAQLQLDQQHPQPPCPIGNQGYLVVSRIPPSGWETAPAARSMAEGLVTGESLSRHCLTLYFDFSLWLIAAVIIFVNKKRCWGTFYKCACLIILISERNLVDKKGCYLLFTEATWTLQGCTGWLQPHKAPAEACRHSILQNRGKKRPSSAARGGFNLTCCSGT